MIRLIFAAALWCGAIPAIAGSVSGVVLDETGAPMPGVSVDVVYQSYRADQLNNAGESIKETAVTSADGRYSIVTDYLPPGELTANAYVTVSNGGSRTVISYASEDSTAFGRHEDVVRNFAGGVIEMSDELPYGNAGVFVLSNYIMDYSDLTPAVVTLVNAETGKTYIKPLRSTGEGLTITGIPFGTYTVSATLDDVPLQLSLRGPGIEESFGPSVTHDFTMGWMGNQMQVMARL